MGDAIGLRRHRRRRRDARWRRPASSSPAADEQPTTVPPGRIAVRCGIMAGASRDRRDRGRGSCARAATAGPPRSACVPAGRPRRRVDRLLVAAIDPEAVGEVGRADLGIALGVGAVAGGAVRREHCLAGRDRCRPGSVAAAGRQAAAHRRRRSRSRRAPACRRGRRRASATPGLGMGRIDADADGLGDRLGRAAPQPRRGREVREALAALGVAAVAGRAIVAEQRAAGLAHGRHQARDRLRSAAKLLAAIWPRPDRAVGARLLHRCRDRRARSSAPSRPFV